MYKKLIGAAVLFTFVCVQLGYSLECYDCNTPATCKKPGKVVCTTLIANNTNNLLKNYFASVPDATENASFDCIFMNYTENNNAAFEVKGCLFRMTQACQLQLNPSVGLNWSKETCKQCSGNLCNPAATFSSSSSFTLFASVLVLITAKIFAL